MREANNVDAYIYVLYEPLTTEIRYVGQAVNLRKRFNGHMQDARNGKKTKCYTWIRRLLRENKMPIMDKIHECKLSEANYWEIYYVKYYLDSGHRLTNMTSGGQNGFIQSQETIEQMRIGSTKKRIFYSINIKTKEAQKHESTLDLFIKFGFSKNDRIYAIQCCNNRKEHKTKKGYVFVYEEEFNKKSINQILLEKIPPSVSKPVLQYDLDGNFIQEFDSVNKARLETKQTSIWITLCCDNKNSENNKKYQWKWKTSDIIILNIEKSQNKKFKVTQYNSHGELLAMFDSIKEASDKTGIGLHSISKVINGKRKMGGGFLWKCVI